MTTSSSPNPEVARLLADPTLPAPVRQFLTTGGQLERITLDEEGRFWHQGEPFLNPALIALFSRSLLCTPGGTWMISIPPFSYPIELADTPYFVRGARLDADAVLLSLSDDTEERLDPASLRYVEGRGLYCRVKDGKPARLLRPAYFALADHITEGPDGFHLELGKQHLAVPSVPWERARQSKA